MKGPTYRFEQDKNSRRTEEAARSEFNVFVQRLGLPRAWAEEQEDLLLKYITDVQLNIQWYDRKVKREKALRNLYVGITLALMALAPILVLWLNQLAEEMDIDNPDLVIVQITAAITGLLALHKGISAWFEQRKLIGNFWEAGADLKEALYDLEDKWERPESEWTVDDLTTFADEVQLGLKFAKRIVHKEQKEFFKQYKTPKFDLLGLLTGADSKVASFTELFLDPLTISRRSFEKGEEKTAIKLAEDLTEAQAEVKQFQLEVIELEKLIERRTEELTAASSEDEKASLRSSIRELQKRLDRAEANLISARATVTSLITVTSLVDNI